MIPAIKRYLLEHWKEFGFGDKPGDLLFIKFMDRRIRRPEVGCLIFLVKKNYRFREEPVLIVKMPRYAKNPGANLSLTKEFDNLNHVRSKLMEKDILGPIPRPVFLTTVDSYPVFAMSFLPGEDLGMWFISPDPLESAEIKFNLAFNWLTKFQRLMGGRLTKIDEDFIGKYVTGTIEKYRNTFSRDPSKHKSYFDGIHENSRKYLGREISLFLQHGDFHASNLFVEKGEISGVIDWEDFSSVALPCYDLVYFIRTYTDALYHSLIYRSDPDSIERLSNSTRYFEIVDRIVEHYCEKFEIDPEFMSFLLPLNLIQALNAGGDPRKMAFAHCEKLEILLRMQIGNVRGLVGALSAFAYRDMGGKAYAEGNLKLAEVCKDRANKVFRRFPQRD